MNEELYPLTNAQKNFLQMDQTYPNDNSLYTIYSLLRFPHNVDLNIMDKIVNKVYELNDSTRIKLVKKENSTEYYQYIEKYSYKKTDIFFSNSDDVNEIINEHRNIKFSIDGSLNKIFIVKSPSHVYILFFSHHILADGYGLTTVANQLKDFYYYFENNKDFSDYPTTSYINFIKREEEYLASSRYEKDELYWKEQVKKIEPCTIFKESNSFSIAADRYNYTVPTELAEKIEEYCQNNKITEYSFYLAIVSLYFKYSYNMNNITFGTPYLNRLKRNNEFLDTGLHICTLPLNIQINSDETIIDLCNEINSNNLALYKHANYPYNSIQELYKLENNIKAPLYEIGFSYQIGNSEKEFISNCYKKKKNDGVGQIEWIFSGTQLNCLTFHVTQLNGQKLFSIDYLLSLFNENQVKRINNILISLIEQAINGTKLLNKFNILLPEEIKFLKKFNSTGNLKTSEKNVVDVFEDTLKKYPNKTAIIFNHKRISYEDFNNRVNYLAKYLQNKKIKKSTPVVLFFDKSIEMLISIFAVLKSGCYYVPILPDENAGRINYIINDCNPSCILTHNNYENLVSSFNINTYNVDNVFKKFNSNEKYEFKETKISPNDLCYMIYTSGSTGKPKGVQIMHKNIVGFIQSMQHNQDLKARISDVSMSLLKYSFDASGIDFYSSLLIGGTLLLLGKNDELNPMKVLELIEKYKVTRSFLIPKWIEHIVDSSLSSNYDISSLKLLGTGGETLKPSILKTFTEKYPDIKIANLYGPSEATMFATYKIVSKDDIDCNYTSIGTPIPYSRIAIINSNNNFMPINTEGELIIYEDENSIKNIAKGYLNLEEQTKERFTNIYNPITNSIVSCYKTGDYAKINNNMEIEFVGRKDDIVKVNGGYLIALNEVETAINNLLTNIESYAVAVPYKNTKAIVLFVKTDEKSISVNTIKNYLKSHLSFYMHPKKIIQLTEIPRISSGKVDRQFLKDMATKELLLQKNNVVKPKTDLENEIYSAVKELTTLEEFSVNDDFIDDIGIDSLSLTSLSIALKKYNLNMQDFYSYSTIQDLAYFIENRDELKNLLAETDKIEKIKNNSTAFDLSTVLLTGATGFLGIHLLKELLLNKSTKKIYCIIRNKIGKDGAERLKDFIKYYFDSDEKIVKLVSEKVIILNGDISEKNFNLDTDIYNLLQKEVTTVINSAANVKHFEKPEQIRKDNVLSVDNIIEFCQNNINLAHMSTLSIAGFHDKNTMDTIFNENTLYINQSFNNNPYLISKFNAEIHIFNAINNKNLNAKIFRLGNIMPRQKDGKFQRNYKQNIFISAMKNIFNLQMISNDLLDLKVEFSPVDECAKSIVYLLKSEKQNVYHIINNNLISIKNIVKNFEKVSTKFSVVNSKIFVEALNNNSDEYVKEYILGNNINKYTEKITIKELKNYNFIWSKTDEKYIKNIIKIINDD